MKKKYLSVEPMCNVRHTEAEKNQISVTIFFQIQAAQDGLRGHTLRETHSPAVQAKRLQVCLLQLYPYER